MDVAAIADELGRRDETVAAAIAVVEEAERRTDAVRAAAREIASLRERLPALTAEAETAVAAAAAELRERREGAEQELDGVDEAELQLRRDLVSRAERRLARAREEQAELEGAAARSEVEAQRLEGEAGEAARSLRTLPRLSTNGLEPPGPGLANVLEWASRARAALFVVHGGLDGERELIVREANELGAAVLGEPLAATSVSLVRERLGRALAPPNP